MVKRKPIKNLKGRPLKKDQISKKERRLIKSKKHRFNHFSRKEVLSIVGISLQTFRRLCIYKGIQPISRPAAGIDSKVPHYHRNAITQLLRDPLTEIFRAQMKHNNIKKSNTIGNSEQAKLDFSYNLDHIIKERYPKFEVAIQDLDDALTFAHIFSYLKNDERFELDANELIRNCQRLCAEFRGYIAQKSLLRKIYATLKGYYYETSVIGNPIIWSVPHKFVQSVPGNVDANILFYTMEIYEKLLKFVNIKLFSLIEMPYPDNESFEIELNNNALKEYLEAKQGVTRISDKSEIEEEIESIKVSEEKEVQDEEIKEIRTDEEKEVQDEEMKEIRTDEEKEVQDEEMKEIRTDEEKEVQDEEMKEIDIGFDDQTGNEITRLLKKEQEESEICQKLFKNLIFYISRECPFEPLIFAIRSFGGLVAWSEQNSILKEEDENITHHIIDRPVVEPRYEGREYIQPQWVFDSCNARILLPIELYTINVKCPPHLSPFVDDVKEGYMPDFAKRIIKYKENSKNEIKNEKNEGFLADIVENDPEVQQQMEIDEAIEDEEEYKKELDDEMGIETIDIDKKEKKKKKTAEDVLNDMESLRDVMLSKSKKKKIEKLKKKKIEKTDKVKKLEWKKALADNKYD